MRRLRVGLLLCVAAFVAGASGTTGRIDAAAAGPEALLGVWVPDAAPRGLLTSKGKTPPLTAAASKLYTERRQRLSKGDASFDPTTWCAGPGMPRILTMPYPLEIRADASRIAFIHGWYRWFRIVDLGAGTADPPLSLTMGFPVGHWEASGLVIRTTGLSDTTVMDASGLPHSEQLTVTERLRVLPDGRLEDRITIDDPENYTQSWDTVLTFHRDASARVTDDVCPDRMARGEPAEQVAVARTKATRTTPISSRPAAVAANSVGPAPRLAGVWEPKTFGIMVPNAPLSSAGQDFVGRNAAAMQAGKIMQTAWVSCRPGAVSTMTMPREKIVVLESAGETTILFEMPRMVRRIRMNASHPQTLEPGYVGDSVGHWEATPWLSTRWASMATPNSMRAGSRPARACIQSNASRRLPMAAASTSRRRSRIRSTTRSPSPSNAPGRRARRAIRSSTTAWRIPGRRTSRTRTTCVSAIARSACE